MSLNTISTTQYVTNEMFVRYVNYLAFAKVANRNLEEDFRTMPFATGQTINYRLESRYLGGEGASAKIEGRKDKLRPLTIEKQFHSMVAYSAFELTFDRARDKPYLDMQLNPRAKRLANLCEKYIADKLQYSVWQAVGTPGAGITFDTIAQADAYMSELGVPEDGMRYIAVSPRQAASLSTSLSTIFNNTVNEGALMDGFIGHLAGFDFFKSNFLKKHVSGIGGAGVAGGATPPTGFLNAGTVTNGPISQGNTITVTGVSPNALVFKAGDQIEVADAAGVFMVNPETYEALEQRAQFVVTADVYSTGSTAVIPVNPAIVTTGADKNISAPIPNGAQLWLAASYSRSIAFHSSAIVFAAPPLTELRGGVEAATTYSNIWKLAMTYSLGADIRNYAQLDRIDVAAGCAVNPEFAVTIRG